MPSTPFALSENVSGMPWLRAIAAIRSRFPSGNQRRRHLAVVGDPRRVGVYPKTRVQRLIGVETTATAPRTPGVRSAAVLVRDDP